LNNPENYERVNIGNIQKSSSDECDCIDEKEAVP